MEIKEQEVKVPQVLFPDVTDIHIARLNAYGRTLVRVDLDAVRSAGVDESVLTRVLSVAPQLFHYMDELVKMVVGLGFDGAPNLEEIKSLLMYVESAVRDAPSRTSTP